MRPGYSTITPAVVHRLARSALQTAALAFRPYKQSVTVVQLLDLLVLVAATTRTLFAVATRYFDSSHETARQAVRAEISRPSTILAGRLTRRVARDRRVLAPRSPSALDPGHRSARRPLLRLPNHGPHHRRPEEAGHRVLPLLRHRGADPPAPPLHREFSVECGKGLKPHEQVKALLEQCGTLRRS